MGNNSLLEARNHIVRILLTTQDASESEHIYRLVEALETLVNCEHTINAIDSWTKPRIDFPSNLDWD